MKSAGVVVGLLAAESAMAAFVPFVIRSNPVINVDTPAQGQTQILVTAGGQKAGLGSSEIDGRKVGEIANVGIDRLDDRSRFVNPGPPQSIDGGFYAPYLNLWVKDSAGRYAVLANEPSNGEWNGLYNNGYSFGFGTLSTKIAKVFEAQPGFVLPTPSGPNNSVNDRYLFSDFADYVIDAPTVAELIVGWVGLGSGAPRELSTFRAYGVNWIFGDTLSNYLSGPEPGYIVSNARVSAIAEVPEPATASLVLAALAAAAAARRRRASSRCSAPRQ